MNHRASCGSHLVAFPGACSSQHLSSTGISRGLGSFSAFPRTSANKPLSRPVKLFGMINYTKRLAMKLFPNRISDVTALRRRGFTGWQSINLIDPDPAIRNDVAYGEKPTRQHAKSKISHTGPAWGRFGSLVRCVLGVILATFLFRPMRLAADRGILIDATYSNAFDTSFESLPAVSLRRLGAGVFREARVSTMAEIIVTQASVQATRGTNSALEESSYVSSNILLPSGEPRTTNLALLHDHLRNSGLDLDRFGELGELSSDKKDLGEVHEHESDHGTISPVNRVEQLLGFLGKWHVLAVHLPIAFLSVAALSELGGWWGRRERWQQFARACFVIGALGSLVAVALGWFAADGATYSGDLADYLIRHRYWGVSIALVAVLGILALMGERQGLQWCDTVYRICVFALGVMVPITAHLGGSLVYGPNYLF